MKVAPLTSALVIGVLALATAPSSYAQTPPVLKIGDNSGNAATIDDTGTVIFSGACTPATCSTATILVSPGHIVWGGTIGTFTVVFTVGTSKTPTSPSPRMDLAIQHLTTTAAGTITFQWTDINFNTPGITGGTLTANGNMFDANGNLGGGSSTYSAYFDNSNAEFGMDIPVGTVGLNDPPVTGPGPTTTPFSMTEVATINLNSGSTLTVDVLFVALPSPLTLMCAAGTGQVGVPFSSALIAAGGVPPYTFSISSGSLPTGLTLNPSTGAITGTPSAPGTFSFTAQVVDSSGNSLKNTTTAVCSIVVTQPPPISLQCPGATGQVGVFYNSSLVASGGIPPYTFSISAGSLPTGLTLNPSTGAITGTPTTAGPFLFTAQVKDSTNTFAGTTTSNCGITIAPPPLTLACATSTGQVGVAYSSALVAGGGTPGYTFSISIGSLPAGLTLNTSTGAITGTPTTAGTFSFTAKVMDSTGGTALTTTSNCSITIAPPPLTLACATSTGQVGVAYSSALVAGGGTPGYTFSISIGSLPAGLTLNTSTGAITGTPTTAGTFSFTAKVMDSTGGTALTTTSNCSITIAPPPLTLACATSTGQVGVAYSSALVAGGGTPGYTFSISIGSLPAGLTLNTSTGAITGTPTTAGTFSFTAKVMDSTGGTALTTTSNCSITIAPPPLTLACATSTGQVGVAYSSALVAGGGTPGYTFSISIGSLPAGLTLNTSTGAITGTPTTAGTFSFTAKVMDSTGGTALTTTSNCSITIAPPPLTLACATSTGQVGVAYSSALVAGGGTPGYTFSISIGSLPAGLTLNTSTGAITGTPTTAGTFSFTAKVMDSTGGTALTTTSNCSITIAPPVSSTCVSITAIQGVAITPVTMVGSGGAGGPYTFSATGLPAGLTMSSGGTISGTPTVSGTFSYTVTVKDKNGNTGTLNCSLTVTASVPLSLLCPSGTGKVGTPYNSSVVASGGVPPYVSYALVSGALPGGLSLNASTGAITGTPNTAGTFNFSIKVTDSVGNTANSTCSGSCTTVTATWDFSTKLGDQGTSTPYTVNGVAIAAYGYTSANAPSNLFGKHAGGDENGLGLVNDSGNNDEIDTTHYIQLDFTQVIAAGATSAQMTVSSVQSGESFAVYGSNTLGSIGTLLYSGTSAQDTVPFAIPNFATYKYIAVKATTANVLLSAVTFTLNNCSIVISPSVPLSLLCPTGTGKVGTPYNSSVVASGGVPPYVSYALVSGALPGGLSLNTSTGAITGIPNGAGTFSFSVKVTDSVGNTAISTCSGSCTSVATTWDFSTELGDLGTSEAYTVNGITVTAYGYTSANAPSNLYGKHDGGDENGIGMVNDSGNDHEIDTTHYLQLDFTQAIAAGATSAKMSIGSIQSGEGFAVYGSNTLGSIGTLLLTGTSSQDTVPFAIPSFGTYKYIAVKATAVNVLLNSVTFTLGNCSIVISPSAPLSLLCPSGTGKVGTPYSSSVVASGGVTPYVSYALVSGALPGGLSLNTSTGAITGTPNGAGTFSFSIKVTDSAGNTAISTCSGTCTSVATVWDLSTKLGDLGTSEPYTVNGITVTAYGYTTANAPSNLYGKHAGGDENGIGMVNDSGNDHEIDTAHYIQLDLTQAIAAGATNAKMTIGSVQSGEGFAVYGSNTLGGIGTLLLTGTTTQDAVPFAIPNFPNYKYVAVKATSANVLLNAITFTLGNCTITIAPSGVKINLSCGSCGGSNSTYILQSFTDTLTATGGNGHYTFSIASGAFPPGMSLNASTGAITGKPYTGGTYTFTVTVVDTNGGSGSATCTIVVMASQGMQLGCGTCGASPAHLGQSYSATVAPSGGSGAMQFGVIYGSLPPGLSQDQNTGKVTGTPTQTGTYMFDTGVMDSKQNWAVTTCTLIVQ